MLISSSGKDTKILVYGGYCQWRKMHSGPRSGAGGRDLDPNPSPAIYQPCELEEVI